MFLFFQYDSSNHLGNQVNVLHRGQCNGFCRKNYLINTGTTSQTVFRT